MARQAEQSECRRETLYQHTRTVELRLASEPGAAASLAELRAESQRRRQRVAALERAAEDRVRIDKDTQRQLATTAFAMGLSLRPIEELLGRLLPESKAPDHSTLGHWVQAEAERAGRVLTVIDEASAPHGRSLALDAIFVGGDRLWSESNRPA